MITSSCLIYRMFQYYQCDELDEKKVTRSTIKSNWAFQKVIQLTFINGKLQVVSALSCVIVYYLES